jgi:hypothetical protein
MLAPATPAAHTQFFNNFLTEDTRVYKYKWRGFSVTQMFLLSHSQHISVQISYHQVISEKYANDEGIL